MGVASHSAVDTSGAYEFSVDTHWLDTKRKLSLELHVFVDCHLDSLNYVMLSF